MKKVSVVVPCYNASMYLDQCIEHLLRQTIGLENMEIILVDDASTDEGKTWEVITRCERQFPDTIIAVSLERNMRQGGARNAGIAYAGGEYLIFCDADDWLLEETLEHCYRAAKEYDADVVEFLIHDINDRSLEVELIAGDRSCLKKLDTEEEKKQFLIFTDNCWSLGSQKKMYRLSLIKDHRIQFMEHVIFEEPSFMVPVRCYETKHYFLDEQLYICCHSSEGTTYGGWGEHKWDNPYVWTELMKDMKTRGLFEKYYDELEYLFWNWGFGLSVRMTIQKGYVITGEELRQLIDTLAEMFPDVVKNKYLQADQGTWSSLMLTVLNMEITDESVRVINDILRKYA